MPVSTPRCLPRLYALLAVVVFSSCGKQTPEPAGEPSIRPAKLIVLEAADTVRSSRFPGVVAASEFAELSFQVGGKLQELPVSKAQTVKKGDMIARLELEDFTSSVSSVRAQFETAQSEFLRAERLLKEDAIARSVVEQRKSQRDSLMAQLATAEKALSNAVLRAPFSGVIANLEVENFQSVQAGQQIAALFNAEALDVTINMPADMLAGVRSRTNRSAHVMVQAETPARLPAVFKEAALEADPVSQTYEVTFSFEPPKDLIVLPGMNVEVQLSSTSIKDDDRAGLSVPLESILSDGSEQYVWRVDTATMQVSRRAVQVAEGIGEQVVVLDGLAPGDTIVGAGGSFLSEGMIVRPWTH